MFSFTTLQKGLAWKIRFGSHELIVGIDDVVQGDGKCGGRKKAGV